jgi:hypothetical protein
MVADFGTSGDYLPEYGFRDERRALVRFKGAVVRTRFDRLDPAPVTTDELLQWRLDLGKCRWPPSGTE